MYQTVEPIINNILTPTESLDNILADMITVTVESMLKAAEDHAVDLRQSTIDYAVAIMPSTRDDYQKIDHPVHWEIVLELGYIDKFIGTRKEQEYWKLSNRFPGFNEISISAITGTILKKHSDYLRCRLTGCKTMKELWDYLYFCD